MDPWLWDGGSEPHQQRVREPPPSLVEVLVERERPLGGFRGAGVVALRGQARRNSAVVVTSRRQREHLSVAFG